MKLKLYVYVKTQYKRHGVKEESSKKARSSSVKNQLTKFLKEESEDKASREEKRARDSKPYGSSKMGTNTHYFIKGDTYTYDTASSNSVEEKKEIEAVIERITNIATRLEAKQQYDISSKKEIYKREKTKAFQEIMGDRISMNPSAEQYRNLHNKLVPFTFIYYESQLIVTVLCDELIDSLSHCREEDMTDDGLYVYHIKSKRLITANLLSMSEIESLDKDSSGLVKLLPSKEGLRFKVTLLKVLDGYGNIIDYQKIMSKLEDSN